MACGSPTCCLTQRCACLARRERDATPHWPPPLVVPPELEEEGEGGEGGAPEVFKCPITLSIMTEPAQTPAGARPGCHLSRAQGAGLPCPGGRRISTTYFSPLRQVSAIGCM